MNLKHVVIIAASVFIMSILGCAVDKQLTATGGSRADGIVKLSYEYGLFERPQLDGQQGITEARQRCSAWGYRNAQPFDGARQKCINHDGTNCLRWLVTIDYQCTN